jgi:glutamine cyclotransferase
MSLIKKILMKRSLIILFYLKTFFLIALILQKEIKPLKKNKLQLKEKSKKTQLSKNSLIPNTIGYSVTKILKRNKALYTQGLFFEDNGKSFYESGGLYNESTINHYSYPSLAEIKSKKLNKKFFAEGIAQCGDFIFQLTWRENKILKYLKKDFSLFQELPLNNGMNEGWGLSAFKDNLLIGTDGSNRIFVLDCVNDLEKIDVLNVQFNNRNLNSLNDLIYANGFIYANRYHDSKVYKINPQNGVVVKAYEMKPLEKYEVSKMQNGVLRLGDVLNGIAFNSSNNKFLLTGKRWKNYFEVLFDKE